MIGEHFENYIITLNLCGTFLLEESDDIIGTCIFEDFDIDCRLYLNYKPIDYFKKAGFIDEAIAEKSNELLTKTMNLHLTKLWNIESFRTAKEWLEIMQLSDEIKRLIHEKWSNAELLQLYDLNYSDFGF